MATPDTAAIPPVLTITLNPAIDLNMAAPDWPKGDFVRATTVRRAAGGKGMNVSRVLAELRLASTAFCVVGGPDAQVFLSLLAGVPFEVYPHTVSQPTRTNVTLSIERGGEQIKVNQPGPRLSRREWAQIEADVRSLLPGRQWVVLSGALPPGAPDDAYARLARLAHRAGAKVALDCAGPSLLNALPQHPELIKPNRAELSATLGQPCRTRAHASEAANALLRQGAQGIVVSHGAGECLAADGEGLWLAQPPRIKADSPMGAGDSLVAGLVGGLLKGLELAEALRLGVSCGAACAMAPDTVLARRPLIGQIKRQVRVTRLR